MRSLFLSILSGLLACSAAAVIVDSYPIHTWVLDDENDYASWTDPDRWESNSVPPANGTAIAMFPGLSEDNFDFRFDFEPNFTEIELFSDADLVGLVFGEGSFYRFNSGEGAALRIREGITANSEELSSFVEFGSGLAVVAAGDDLELDIGFGSQIQISDRFELDAEKQVSVTGGGLFILSGDNSHGDLTGTIQINEGFLGLAQNTSAGGATIYLGDPESTSSDDIGIVALDGDRRIGNSIFVNGYMKTFRNGSDDNELNLDGLVTFSGDTEIQNYGGLLSFFGGITETSAGTSLQISTEDPVLFAGPTGITGGIEMQEGAAIFIDYSALPDVSPGSFFSSDSDDTYVGLMIDSSTDRFDATGDFLALFDRSNFDGAIGFDTDPESAGAINSYSAPIDLTGFSEARIGSVTVAEVTGEITPSGLNYQFGVGGGVLQVGSLLTDPEFNGSAAATPGEQTSEIGAPTVPRGITARSTADAPLTVYINNGSNSFTGTVTAEHSAIIFGNVPGALPTDAILAPAEGGYIGLQDATRSIASYLAQFESTLDEGIIGFDSQDRNTNSVISASIDLSAFNATDPDFYLGTTTQVELAGQIILPENADDYRFTGYKGGSLDISSTLTDAENTLGVIIGDQNSPATFGHDFAGENEGGEAVSRVRLSGANTYSGGTQFEAGELILTNNASLGTGQLTIAGESLSFTDAIRFGFNLSENRSFDFKAPILSTDTSDLVVGNDIQVDSMLEIDVQVALTDENLTLAGDIAGDGGIDKNGNGTLNLNGDNSDFTGGLYISEGTVNINTDTGTGTGPVGFGSDTGSSSSGQYLVFNSMAPTIGGLYEIRDYEDEYYSFSNANVELASGSTLTIDVNGNFLDFGGTITGDGSVRLEGEGTQRLSGYNSFTGGLEVGDGANLIASDTGSLGSGYPDPAQVTLDGGSLTLDLDSESSIEASLSFGSSGGEIRGNGILDFGDPLAIGDGASISPGFSIGKIEFQGPLELEGMGLLDVEIGDGNNDEIISDVVFADTIDITASSATPFSISVRGENGELPNNFDAMQAYSWSVLLAGDSITNFDAMAFDLSVSAALQSLGGEGIWSLQLASSGNDFSESFLTNNVVQLTFTPIPEPSTFALVAMGMVLVTFQAGRRRRATR